MHGHKEAAAVHAMVSKEQLEYLVEALSIHLDLLNNYLDPEQAASAVGLFVIGGENLEAEKLRFWRKFAPSTRLINEYGPTETVVGCCTYEVKSDDPDFGSVPIGKPIANTRLYVLDETMRAVPSGATGELYIGGSAWHCSHRFV